jgi:tetratricopeptide (TPR) repeat protein
MPPHRQALSVSGYIMTTLKFITAFLLIAFYSCGQNSAKHKPDPAAVLLNNQAMTLVRYIDNADSSKKAISLLDQATEIDSNYFLGYSNKLMFFFQLKQFDKLIQTNNKLIQLRPSAHDLYLTGGMFYEQIGDTVSANRYFTKSLTICNAVLDTMNNKNRDFVMLTTNQAINLIMLNDSAKANNILKVLYDNQSDDPQFENVEKKYIQSLMNKNKKDLVDTMSNPDKYIR